MTNNNVTVTINEQTVTADLATIAALLNMACESSMDTAQARPKAKTAKAEAKAHEIRSKHDAILDSKRVERMTRTALGKLESAAFECKARKQGRWGAS